MRFSFLGILLPSLLSPAFPRRRLLVGILHLLALLCALCCLGLVSSPSLDGVCEVMVEGAWA